MFCLSCKMNIFTYQKKIMALKILILQIKAQIELLLHLPNTSFGLKLNLELAGKLNSEICLSPAEIQGLFEELIIKHFTYLHLSTYVVEWPLVKRLIIWIKDIWGFNRRLSLCSAFECNPISVAQQNLLIKLHYCT